MVPINSIEIPARFVAIASEWFNGMSDLLYAVCSTGGLTTGNRRPMNDYGEWASDEEWYHGLWVALSVDVGRARLACGTNPNNSDDLEVLTDFEAWVDGVILRLEAAYGLE